MKSTNKYAINKSYPAASNFLNQSREHSKLKEVDKAIIDLKCARESLNVTDPDAAIVLNDIGIRYILLGKLG